MSKYKVGDKVRTIKDRDCKIGIITDIDEDANFPYQVRVGDDNYYYSEDMLEPYNEKTYEDGLNDAWELAKKLFADMSDSDLNEIFGKDWNYPKLMRLTPQEALAKIKAYEESKAIKVGDVVKTYEGHDGVVVNIKGGRLNILCDDGDLTSLMQGIGDCCKTSRHIDIEHLLEQIRGNE